MHEMAGGMHAQKNETDVFVSFVALNPPRTLQENGKQLLMDVLDGLEDALAALTELERQWSR